MSSFGGFFSFTTLLRTSGPKLAGLYHFSGGSRKTDLQMFNTVAAAQSSLENPSTQFSFAPNSTMLEMLCDCVTVMGVTDGCDCDNYSYLTV